MVVEVVIVNTVVLVTTVEPVPGTVVGVVGDSRAVEVVVTLGRTLNKAVAQVCDPCRHAIIW